MLAKLSFGSVTSEIMAAFWEWWCCGLGINREILCHPPSPQYCTSVGGAREKTFKLNLTTISHKGRPSECSGVREKNIMCHCYSRWIWRFLDSYSKACKSRAYLCCSQQNKIVEIHLPAIMVFWPWPWPGARFKGGGNILELEQKQEKWSMLGVQCKTKVTAVYFLYFFRRVADI